MRVHRDPLTGAVLLTAITTGVALVALSPRRPLRPTAVSATAYFTPTEIERASAFSRPQRRLGAGNLAITTGILVGACFPPAGIRRRLHQVRGRPIASAFWAGSALALVASAAELPLSLAAYRRRVAFGLSTQTRRAWAQDTAKSWTLGAGAAGSVSAVAASVMRRYPRRFWVVAAGLSIGASVMLAFAAPIAIEPIFNRFTPLAPGRLRSEVTDLARRAGIEVGEVFSVNASRRTTGANAYVAGLAKTKRVVLFDTLIDQFSDEQIRSVVAHELAHVKHRDLWRGLAFASAVCPPAMLAVQLIARRVSEVTQAPPATAGAVYALALGSFVVFAPIRLAGNHLSRALETRADVFALELTADPDAAVALEHDLASGNLSEPAPPRTVQFLFGTHPTALERIGLALAWQKQQLGPHNRAAD